MAILTLDQIRAASKREAKAYPIASLDGGEVSLKGMGGRVRGDFMTHFMEHGGPDGIRPKLGELGSYQIRLVALCLCGEDGQTLVRYDSKGRPDESSLAEVEAAVGELPGAVIDEIATFAAPLSGVKSGSDGKAEGSDLGNAQTANSSTD